MLRIGICDDEPYVIEVLSKKIQEVRDRNDWNISISSYTSGKSLLEEEKKPDVVFLDIDMPDLDGIETGKKLQKINSECKIVMATGRTDKFKDAFRIHAFRFVTKPFQQSEIEEAIQAVLYTKIELKMVELYGKRNLYHVCQRDIMYAMSYDGYTEFMVTGKNGERTLRKDCALSEVEKMLSKELFFRVNRQYMINMAKIADYRQGKVFIGGKQIMLSRRRKKEFEQAYVEFDLKYNA